MSNLRNNQRRGFTLIEVLVSLSIFTIVVTISVSALYSLIDANARSRNSQSVATNLSFMLDSMTREIRTGTHYYCATSVSQSLPTGLNDTSTQDCTAGNGVAMAFNEGGQSLTQNASSRRIAYRLNEGRLQRRLGNGTWLNLTAEDVEVESLQFSVEGSSITDDLTPIATIYIKGRVGDEETNRDDFDIQTTITQRLLDI